MLTRRAYKVYGKQSGFSQRASTFEFVTTELIRRYLGSDKDILVNKVFFSPLVWKLFTRYRLYYSPFYDLGDTTIDDFRGSVEFGDVNGIWIYSKTRLEKYGEHDIVLYFVHGGKIGTSTSYTYVEYFSIFLINLLQQGFSNPGIFMIEQGHSRNDGFVGHLSYIARGYEYLNKSQMNAHLVLIGDSTGGTLILSLLLHIARPCIEFQSRNGEGENSSKCSTLGRSDIDSFIGQSTEMEIGTAKSQQYDELQKLKRPSSMILISPIPSLINSEHQSSNDGDIITPEVLRQWDSDLCISEESSLDYYHNPGLCDDEKWWKEAFPSFGVVVSFGADEMLCKEIEELCNKLKPHGRLKIDKRAAQLHDWAILSFFTERQIDHREASISYFTGVLSRMLLWSTDEYFRENAKEPTNIVTIDDDYLD